MDFMAVIELFWCITGVDAREWSYKRRRKSWRGTDTESAQRGFQMLGANKSQDKWLRALLLLGAVVALYALVVPGGFS